MGLIWFVVFLFSTTCHEGAHALAAKLGGDPTASGQITLNPSPHIKREPFGMVLVPLLSYFYGGWMMGWASAPYDPDWAYRHPHRAARMALAGPAANFFLMFTAAITMRLGLSLGIFQPANSVSFTQIVLAPDSGSVTAFLAIFFSVLFILNLILGTFNLLPVPPLDGNLGVTIFMTEAKARAFLEFFQRPSFGILGIFLAWTLFGRIFDVVFTVALNVLYIGIASYG